MSGTQTVHAAPASRHHLEAELRRIMRELDDLVEPMRWEASRNRRGHGVHPGWMAICGGLAILSILSVGSVLQAIGGGSWLTAIVLLPLGAAAIYEMARLWPRSAPEMHRLTRQRRTLIARKKQLERLLAGSATDATGRPTASGPIPRIRRPTDFAQVMWHSGGRLLGPSPADALRSLPEGTSWARLAFHRYLGWGFPITLLAVLAILTMVVTTT